MEKRRNCSKGAISPLFHNIFNISTFRSQITYTFVKCGCSIYFFLNSANLICRGTDISKCFRESLGIRDNESWLYISNCNYVIVSCHCQFFIPSSSGASGMLCFLIVVFLGYTFFFIPFNHVLVIWKWWKNEIKWLWNKSVELNSSSDGMKSRAILTFISYFISLKSNSKKTILTLKTPRKPASENVVCLCRLLNVLANFSNIFLHTGKQCGPRSESDLGPHCLQKWLLK